MKAKNLFVTVLLIATMLFTFIFVSALKVDNLTCEKVDTSLYKLSVETETFETNSTMTFQYFDSTWQFIDGDDFPTEIDEKYKWYGLWDTSSLADGTYIIEAVWMQNSTIIGESDLLTVTIDTNPPTPPPITTTPPPTTPPPNYIDITSSEADIISYYGSQFRVYCETKSSIHIDIHNFSSKNITNMFISPATHQYADIVLGQHILNAGDSMGGIINIHRNKIKTNVVMNFRLYGTVDSTTQQIATIILNIDKEAPTPTTPPSEIRELTSEELTPLANGSSEEIIYEGGQVEVTIDTSGLTAKEISSLIGKRSYLHLKQKRNTFYTIHTWIVYRPKQKIDCEVIVDKTKGNVRVILHDFPDKVYVTITNTDYKDELVMNFKDFIITESGDYIMTIVDQIAKNDRVFEEYVYPFTIEFPIPTTLPPTTLPPTTAPPTTSSPTTAPPTTIPPIRELPLTDREIVILVGIVLFAFGAYYKRELIKNKIKKFKERRKFKEDKKEKPTKEDIIKKLEKIDKRREKTLTKEQKIELEKMKRELDEI